MMKNKISCRTFNRNLLESLYGEGSSSTHLALREHARLCPACARILDEMENTIVVLRRYHLPDLNQAELGELRRGFKERVMTSLEKPRQAEYFRPFSLYRLIPAAAMIVIIAVVAWVAFRSDRAHWEFQPEVMEAVSLSETIELELQAMGDLWEEMDRLEVILGVKENNGSEASLPGKSHRV